MPMTFGTDFDVLISTDKVKDRPLKASFTDSCRESVFGVLYDDSYEITKGMNITALSGTMLIRYNSSLISGKCRIGELTRFERVFADLCKVYPNVTISTTVEQDVFSGKYALRVLLTGSDAQIVPVWWWAVVICRILLVNVDADPHTVLDTLNLPDVPRESNWYSNRGTQWDNYEDKAEAIEAWHVAKSLDGVNMFNSYSGPVAEMFNVRDGDDDGW